MTYGIANAIVAIKISRLRGRMLKGGDTSAAGFCHAIDVTMGILVFQHSLDAE